MKSNEKKLIFYIFFSSIIVFIIPETNIFLFSALLVSVVYAIVSGISLSLLFFRTIAILPFSLTVLVSAWLGGLPFEGVFHAFLKSITLIICAVTVFSSVLLSEMTAFMVKIHLPKIFVSIFSFMYRYFFIISSEIEMKIKSVKARITRRPSLKTVSHIAAVLLLGSFLRAEKINMAMIMRRYNE
ncbi:MAG: energy-coupling factor transporter transmembrane component T [Elusimicrobiota bacterium]|nr:energy-coupling factor transporter transmembrane component T [Elusimicrobiota bacterium]